MTARPLARLFTTPLLTALVLALVSLAVHAQTYSVLSVEKSVPIASTSYIPGNVMRYGAKGTCAADDSAALKYAIAVSNAAHAVGAVVPVILPPGCFTISSSAPFSQGNNAQVIGQGPHATKIQLTKSFSGTLFSISDAWRGATYVPAFNPAKDTAGPRVGGFGVWGDDTTTNTQNVVEFYDHEDFALAYDIEGYHVHGQLLGMGQTLNDKEAYTRESDIKGIIRCFWCGTATVPAMALSTTANGGDGTNQIYIEDAEFYGSVCKAFVISNPINAGGGTRLIHANQLRTEDSGCDQTSLGLSTDQGQIAYVTIDHFDAPNNHKGYSGLVIANSGGRPPYGITVNSVAIGSGNDAGNGVNIISAQSDIYVGVENITLQGSKVLAGSAAKGYKVITNTGTVLAQH